MFDDNDSSGTPHRLVGYLHLDDEPPIFVVPVFKNLDTDKLAVQVVGTDNKIARFLETTLPIMSVLGQTIGLKKSGDVAVFGLKHSDHSPYMGEYDDFVCYIKTLLASGGFDAFPAFALNVAKLTDSADREVWFKELVFSETSKASPKAGKYFLENNVLREGLYRDLPAEYQPVVRNTRISVEGREIILGLPKGIPKGVEKGITDNIGDNYRRFMKSDEVRISFEGADADDTYGLLDKLGEIKGGYFKYHSEILDYPKAKDRFAARESVVLIPEIGFELYVNRQSKSDILSRMGRSRLQYQAISESTVRRIIGLYPVSLISTIMFRAQVLGDVEMALGSPDLMLHVTVFRFEETLLVSDDLRQRLQRNVFARSPYADGAGHLLDTLLPFSMVAMMLERRLITLEEIGKHLIFSRNGYFDTARFRQDFVIDWLEFCKMRFDPKQFASHMEQSMLFT